MLFPIPTWEAFVDILIVLALSPLQPNNSNSASVGVPATSSFITASRTDLMQVSLATTTPSLLSVPTTFSTVTTSASVRPLWEDEKNSFAFRLTHDNPTPTPFGEEEFKSFFSRFTATEEFHSFVDMVLATTLPWIPVAAPTEAAQASTSG